MLDAKKWMYIPLNLKVEFENLTAAYEKWKSKGKTWMLHKSKLNVECKKKLNRECKLKWQTQNIG